MLILLAIISFINGILGALSGAENSSKFFRRFLIPIILTLSSFFFVQTWINLSLLLFIIPFSLGYGIPEENDEGSPIGKFWYNIFKDYHLSNFFTRGTIGLIEGLCLLPLIIYYKFILGLPFIILVLFYNIIVTCFNIDWKTYKLFKRTMLIEETILYSGLSFIIYIFMFLIK